MGIEPMSEAWVGCTKTFPALEVAAVRGRLAVRRKSLCGCDLIDLQRAVRESQSQFAFFTG